MRVSDGYRAVLLGAGLAVAALLVHELATLILAVVIAVIIALPLAVAAAQAERRGAPRALGAVLALVLIAGALTGLGIVLVPAFVHQVNDFTARLPSILSGVQRQLGHLGALHVRNLSAQVKHFVDGYLQHPQRLIGPLGAVSNAAFVIVVGLVVVAVSAFAMAVRPAPLLAFLMRVTPATHRGRLGEVLARIRTAWLGWMTAVVIDMVVLGSLLWAGMAIVGLPFAIGFATFSALMTVIPNYGSVISAVPPILAALSQSPTKAVLVLIVYLVVNQIEGNLILPLIMARTVDMHPAVVSIGLLVMAALFGVIGVFIAIPLLSLFMILVQALWIEPQEAAARSTVIAPGDPHGAAGA